MSTSEVSDLTDLIVAYIDICKIEGGQRGNYSRVRHTIDSKNHPPIRSKPLGMLHICKPRSENKLTKCYNEQDVISKSTSPLCFPVCMVPKPGSPGTYRFTVDFRRLNQICAQYNFPLPNIIR